MDKRKLVKRDDEVSVLEVFEALDFDLIFFNFLY